MGHAAKEKQNKKTSIGRRGLACFLAVCIGITGLVSGCGTSGNHGEDDVAMAAAKTEESSERMETETAAEKIAAEPAVVETEAPEPEMTVKEFLQINVTSQEERDAWIISFGELNVRRFCYSNATVVGTFDAGQKVTVLGPEVYGFYPVTGTDAETGAIIHGYCSADYVSFMEYTGPAVKLDIVKYKQTDSRWGDLKLGTKYTISQIGCTTTCFSMCESYLTGTEITPADMSEILSYTNGGDLYWPDDYKVSYNSDYLSKIYQKLHQGIPVLIGSRRRNGSQHWVLVTGYDPGDKEITKSSQLKAADFIINDPGSGRSNLGEFFKDLPYFIKYVYYIGHEQ